jgi:hypothetical protein
MSGLKALPDKICENCGKTFNRKKYGERMEDAAIYAKRKFCSLSCANARPNPKCSDTYHWQICEVCGGTQMLAAHHKDENPQNNHPGNIETLCVVCHAKHHHGTLIRQESHQE